MNTKYVIATVVIIAIVVVAAFVYVYYQGQATVAEQLKVLQNLVDDTGYTTSLTALPNRIASLAPSATEIVFALGLDEKVVSVSDYCDYPYNFSAWIAAGNMTSIGDFSNPNMEVIASLAPDLIIATGGVQAETVDTLRALNYKVIVLNPSNVSGVLKNIELVGNATGKIDEAKTLIASLNSRIDAVANTVATASKPKVYYEVYYATTSAWTIGSLAYQNDLIEKAGGTNLFGDQQKDYYQYQVEALIARNPDVILLPAGGMGTGSAQSLDDVKARPAWDTTNAVKNDRLYQIDPNLIELATPRFVDAIEQLAEFFHPELF
ncbi:MAG TPA: cobalamin-binding protein [Candidatus Bathyarchaeia archaeon]